MDLSDDRTLESLHSADGTAHQEDIPMMWPNVEQLFIQFGTGLTVCKLREILPQMKSLKVLILGHGPWLQSDQEEALAMEFTAEMWNGPSNILVQFDFTIRSH